MGNLWLQVKRFFKSSETIFLARTQIAVGTILEVTSSVDPNLFSELIGSKWFPVFLIGHGVLTEYLRRRRDDDLANR